MADEVKGNLKEMAIRADELFQHHRSAVGHGRLAW